VRDGGVEQIDALSLSIALGWKQLNILHVASSQSVMNHLWDIMAETPNAYLNGGASARSVRISGQRRRSFVRRIATRSGNYEHYLIGNYRRCRNLAVRGRADVAERRKSMDEIVPGSISLGTLQDCQFQRRFGNANIEGLMKGTPHGWHRKHRKKSNNSLMKTCDAELTCPKARG
jgi:hypothetical protein